MYRCALLFTVFSVFSAAANATSIQTKTVSPHAYQQHQLKYCEDAIHLTSGAKNGRLLHRPEGVVVNACIPLLRSHSCAQAFARRDPKRRTQARAFAKITRECAVTYCERFHYGAIPSLCQAQAPSADRAQWLEFYAAALRWEFLQTNHVEGLRSAQHLAREITDSVY